MKLKKVQMKHSKVLLVNPKSVSYSPPNTIASLDKILVNKYTNAVNVAVQNNLGEKANTFNAFSGKYCVNQGLLMLGTALSSENINVKYFVGDYYETTENFISSIIENLGDTDIICFTATSPQYNEIEKIAFLCKQNNPNVKTILGGAHSLNFLSVPLPDCFDSVQIGSNLKESISNILNFLQKGISLQKIICSFDYYDFPIDFSQLPKDKLQQTMLYSFISYGCPKSCAYCMEYKLCESVNYLDIQRKIKEISYIVNEADAKFIHLADSDFFLDINFADKFIIELVKAGIKACFSVNISPQTIIRGKYREVLKKFLEVGLIEILIGVEHCSPDVLRSVGKPYDKEKFENELKFMKSVLNVPLVSIYMLVGLPYEYEREIQENINSISQWKQKGLFDFTFPKFFIPYPGTDIFLNPQKYKIRLLTDDYDKYQRWCFPRPVEIEGISDIRYISEIEDIYKLML